MALCRLAEEQPASRGEENQPSEATERPSTQQQQQQQPKRREEEASSSLILHEGAMEVYQKSGEGIGLVLVCGCWRIELDKDSPVHCTSPNVYTFPITVDGKTQLVGLILSERTPVKDVDLLQALLLYFVHLHTRQGDVTPRVIAEQSQQIQRPLPSPAAAAAPEPAPRVPSGPPPRPLAPGLKFHERMDELNRWIEVEAKPRVEALERAIDVRLPQLDPHDPAGSCADWIGSGLKSASLVLAGGLQRGASMASSGMRRGVDRIKPNLPQAQEPVVVHDNVRRMVQSTRRVTQGAADWSLRVWRRFVNWSGQASRYISEAVNSDEPNNSQPQEPSPAPPVRTVRCEASPDLDDAALASRADGALSLGVTMRRRQYRPVVTLFSSAIESTCNIFDALLIAGDTVLSGGAENVSDLIRHRYGDDVGAVTRDGLMTGVDAYRFHRMVGALVSPASLARSAIRGTAIEAGRTLEEPENVRTLAEAASSPDLLEKARVAEGEQLGDGMTPLRTSESDPTLGTPKSGAGREAAAAAAAADVAVMRSQTGGM
ncbi:unnamed protein product [Vitrella brassicaformis CCMP3155]|uniref:Senescence domain-containing protein n=2 Tax=Vitrella brassicaformis TaxID=1169539 RepID=A0A0G4ENC7_VITBC|nr:unnamed protein product [Vitrella brassicaformis CCMP3155]|eukprot:CEL98529.1 unnamed protein product [Vitrella brassicaformis CCMP3155]